MTTVGSPTANQPPVSVASSSSAAAAGGSVINVNQLVSELVAATQAPQEALISSKTQAVTAQISALGTLKSALSTFQGSLGSLDTPSAFSALTASTSDSTVLTATASSAATQGTYGITISKLAQAQQLRSNVFPDGSSTAVGTGTLSISLGATSFSVAIDSSQSTLSGIASAINSAAGNPGIFATVLTGSDGAYLVLSSTLTGASNQIAVAETDGGSGLASLTYDTGNTANYEEETAAQDAQFTIAGVPATSASNAVTTAIDGVTLNLEATTAADQTVTLTIGSDTSSIEDNVSAFVSAYNKLAGTLASLGSYDPTSNTAGPMMGNAVLTGIQNQIRGALYSIVDTGSSTYNTLASVGITTQSDGTLRLNQATLSTALSSNLGAVRQLFSGAAGGVATSLNSLITSALGANGTITADGQTLAKQEDALTDQSKQLDAQMAALTASLTQQYAALNTLLSSLQTTSAYLSQAFAALPQVQGRPNA